MGLEYRNGKFRKFKSQCSTDGPNVNNSTVLLRFLKKGGITKLCLSIDYH